MNQEYMLKKYDKKNKRGFSLIELLVAMFIFIIVMGAMVAVSLAGFRSYIKSKAIKTVTEDVGFALNSIAKDVRMGKIESADTGDSPSSSLVVTLNRNQKMVCYKKSATSLDLCDSNSNCSIASNCKSIVDLSGANMTFDATSGFRSQKTSPTVRGWVEINLNIESPTMNTDSIRVQTIVSSRDYGW
jgi:prepilin-type N-terminal cleavage/methylation domain-containing protein